MSVQAIDVDKEFTATLRDCPFCQEHPVFGKQPKSPGYLLRHCPANPCPARCEIFCEDKAFATRLWNKTF